MLVSKKIYSSFSRRLLYAAVTADNAPSSHIHFHDTIFALSSAPGRAAVAIIRISGPSADAILQRLLPRHRPLPPPRVAQLTPLRHPVTSALLDTALCLRFPAPKSATGEDVVELQVHGGPAVVRAVADALLTTHPLVRPAEPGEFTRRAFQLGRLDLTEVEGLADLLAAETESQRVQALAAAGGAARRQCEAWRMMLLRCLARVEAVIDFGEEEDIADEVAAGVVPEVVALHCQLSAHLRASAGGEIVRQGVRVALIGPPNAGKSSLLNALAGREVAIVSDVPGTTRDVLEVSLDLGGYKVILSDSAGVREDTGDAIEAEGVRRSKVAAENAHIVVTMREPGGQSVSLDGISDNILSSTPVLRLMNKIDIVADGNENTIDDDHDHDDDDEILVISCLNGQGLSDFTAKLTELVKKVASLDDGVDSQTQTQKGGVPSLLNRARHRHHVAQCIAALERYQDEPLRLEVAAEELRGAAMALGRVVGAIDTEDVLDSLFSEFCIGK